MNHVGTAAPGCPAGRTPAPLFLELLPSQPAALPTHKTVLWAAVVPPPPAPAAARPRPKTPWLGIPRSTSPEPQIPRAPQPAPRPPESYSHPIPETNPLQFPA